MSGDGPPDDYVASNASSSRNTEVIKALTTVGLLLYAAWALWLFEVVYRATRVSGGVSTGLWEQRVETLAFIGFLPNLAVFALPAIAASVATWMAGPTQQLELAILLRLIRWTANALAAVAVLSAGFSIFGISGGVNEIGTITFRSGGALGAFALSTLCREAGRHAPGG